MWLAVVIVIVLLIVGSRHFEHFTDLADKLYQNTQNIKNLNRGVGSAAAWQTLNTGGVFALDERNNVDLLRTTGGMHVSA